MNVHIHHFHSKGAVADHAALEQFQTQWATYQKLVDADALAHKEVGVVLQRAGDYRHAVRLRRHRLRRCRADEGGVVRDQGKALSRYRLVGARARTCREKSRRRSLRGGARPSRFRHGPHQRPEPADAAWCGLSIYHLSTGGKRDLLAAIRGSTSAFLMIYEPTRLDGESRDDYLARFRRVNWPAWSFLSDEEWVQIDHHVTTCDYPETSATWVALGRGAGLPMRARSSATRRASTASIATNADGGASRAAGLERAWDVHSNR